MKTTSLIGALAMVLATLVSCNLNSGKKTEEKEGGATKKVTPENFIRAETDRMFYDISQSAGGINKWIHYRSVTPIDQQLVIRMNRDVLYSGAIVDAEKGVTVTFPEMPDKRYASILVLDNDHYFVDVIYTPGKHKLPSPTKYLFLAVRIQLFNPNDPNEIALVNKIQDQFIIEANSADEFAKPTWDKASLDSLRNVYEQEFAKYTRYPDDWQGYRGTTNEQTRMIGVAGAWGMFRNQDATYINYNGGNLSGDKCYVATYKVPDVSGFWSITVYGKDGYIENENCIINAANVKYNKDGTFTIHYGAADKCPSNAKNRLDITDGWNIIMRCYLPGKEILDGTYKIPEVVEVK